MRKTTRLALVLLGVSLVGGARPAHAIDSTVRSMIVGSLYGAVAGTALGLISYPFSKSVRGIFMGSSIGLYLGVAVGYYYVQNKHDPGNPLNPRYSLRERDEPDLPRINVAALPGGEGRGAGVHLSYRLTDF